jgi:hypothetical protein
MASTYSNLKIQLMTTGENATTWGNVTNVNLGTALEEAIAGSADVAFSSANVTLTLTDTNATQTARNMRLNLTGTATAGFNLVVPAIEKAYIINNATDGTITVKNATGTGIAVPTGKTVWVYNTGVNVVDATTHLTSLTLGTFLPITSGGTGGNTAAAARTALGVPANDGTGATGTWAIGISGTAANATNATNATTATNATNFVSANFTMTQSGTDLLFKYNGTNIAKLSSAGAFTAINNVTGYGSV